MPKSFDNLVKDRAARLALLVLIIHNAKSLSKSELAEQFHVSLRTIERDFLAANAVQMKLAEMLSYFNNLPSEKIYTVREVAESLNLSGYHVRLLARELKIGRKNLSGVMYFNGNEFEMLKNRPNARNHK